MATYGMVAGPRLMVAGGPEVGLVDGQRSAWKWRGAGQRSSPAASPEAEGGVPPRSVRTGLASGGGRWG